MPIHTWSQKSGSKMVSKKILQWTSLREKSQKHPTHPGLGIIQTNYSSSESWIIIKSKFKKK